MSGYRVTRTFEALYGKQTARKRYRCDGHLNPDRHHIEPGDPYIASALPPDSDIGNSNWWHHRMCMACCPIEYALEDGAA